MASRTATQPAAVVSEHGEGEFASASGPAVDAGLLLVGMACIPATNLTDNLSRSRGKRRRPGSV